MHLHEYQAKLILRKYGVSIPDFAVISSIEEAKTAISELKVTQAVVKVQVHAGGRGKAGGVKLARSKEDILKAAEQLLNMRIINQQTGQEGVIAKQVLISALVDFKKEYYLGVTIDRKRACIVIIASPEGGMEIEEVAEKSPESILTLPIPSNGILHHYQLTEIAKFMKWPESAQKEGKHTVAAVVKAFVDTDASLLEINPLVLTNDDKIVALDAKLSIDENALFRHTEMARDYDTSQLNPYEERAKKHDLAYIALDGNIGCMVNGAGLAMATMDIIKYFGGTPANFLDVGGGATEEKVSEGFKIILSDPKVKAILVNIFGGIMNCFTLASGIINAASELGVHVPLIVRMEGTNVEKGRKLLQDSGLDIIIADTLTDAAEKAVKAAKKRN